MEFSEENAIGDITGFAAVALAEQAERLNLRPLRPLPNFELEDAGNSPLLAREAPHFHRVYTDSTFSPLPSRFGVRAEEDRVILDRSLAGVLEGVVRREILSLFVPAKFLTDLTYELINWDSYYEMGSPESWGQMVKGAAKTYTTEHSFSPTSFNALLRYDKTEFQAFFRRFLRKLVSLSTIVPEDAAGGTVIFLAAALGIQHVAPEYTPDDVAFAKLFFEYLTRERRHPDFTRLKVAGSPFPDETLRALVDRIDTLPFSPSCFYNPAAIGATQCFILFEVPPTASPYAIRQLTFLPNFSQGLSQLLGCPQATYLGIYLFPNQNLAEFRQHLNALKKRGVLLDYHVFRMKAGYELINLNNTLAVPTKSRATPPTILGVASDYQEGLAAGHGMAEKWKTSWVVQQLLPLFMLRSTTLGTVTNLDHARNMESFRGMLIGTAARFRPPAREGMALLLPLLEKYRSVLYVIHLADVARILAKHCAERHLQTAGEINQALSESTEGVASTWAQFPEKDWLGHTYEEMEAGDAGGTAFCSALGGARNALEMFSPYCIPAGQEVFDFLSAAHGQIWEVVRSDVASVPQGPRVMRKYFEQLYDEILQSRLIIPRASLTILPRENVDEFVFVASRCRPFPQVCERMRQKLTPHVAVSYVVRCADESGAEHVIGLIRTTLDKYRNIRKKLVGRDGVLGPDAGIVATRRVVYWDYVHRNFTETFDFLAQDFASIRDYLALLRQEFFAQWVPRIRLPVPPYARTVLEDPFASLIDHRVTPPKHPLRLTPDLGARLKAAYLGGDMTLHSTVKARLGGRYAWSLNWPRYGLDRYILQVFLSARNPRFIFENLITPATRRILISTAVLGFQTAFVEYLWPRDSPDDRFLRYVSSRTDRNVLAYSLHKVTAETRFCNLDRMRWVGASETIDAVDLHVMLLAQPPTIARLCTLELAYQGDSEYLPGSAAYQEACDALRSRNSPGPQPPTGRLVFDFDPRTVNLREKLAVVGRGEFDAMPLCLALPVGRYFKTEEIYYSSTEKLAGQLGHIILFDFPRADLVPLYNFLGDIIRGRTARPLSLYSNLEEQKLTAIEGVNFAAIHPLQANPFNAANERYFHLPKRRVVDGAWHVFSLAEQVQELRARWAGKVYNSEPEP